MYTHVRAKLKVVSLLFPPISRYLWHNNVNLSMTEPESVHRMRRSVYTNHFDIRFDLIATYIRIAANKFTFT